MDSTTEMKALLNELKVSLETTDDFKVEMYQGRFHHLGLNWRAVSTDRKLLQPEVFDAALHELPWPERKYYFIVMIRAIIHDKTIPFLDALFGAEDKQWHGNKKAAPVGSSN